jgi:hypothetical protein
VLTAAAADDEHPHDVCSKAKTFSGL